MELLSDRLKSALQDAATNQTALAEAVGVSKSTVSQWLNGDTENLKMENLFNAARFLGVEAEWLAIGKGPRRAANLTDKADMLARAISAMPTNAQNALKVLIEEIAGGS